MNHLRKRSGTSAFLTIALCLLPLLLPSCALYKEQERPLTQLEIRQLQTREFETGDSKLVMKSMLNVLQDEGFIVKNAVSDLGLLNAEKNIDLENKIASAFITALAGEKARWNKQHLLEASANITPFGDKTRVRINFQSKVIDNAGCVQKIETIADGRYYQIFFEKVSKGIFLQEQDL